MRCEKCGSESPAGKKFCGDCGAELSNCCTSCGAVILASWKFCRGCGAAIDPALSKFVGRLAELAQMNDALKLARSGHGQIVAVVGEAGVGKSRLFHEFKSTSQSGWMVLEAFSVSHRETSAYLPVIDLLRDYFEIILHGHVARK